MGRPALPVAIRGDMERLLCKIAPPTISPTKKKSLALFIRGPYNKKAI